MTVGLANWVPGSSLFSLRRRAARVQHGCLHGWPRRRAERGGVLCPRRRPLGGGRGGPGAGGAALPPPTLFVPQQYSRLARWLAANGLRLVRHLPLMSYGPHPEPAGGYYFPSISY
eukprot:scaffold19626_cov66-Phaeocystis_antarctica.AAC.1